MRVNRDPGGAAGRVRARRGVPGYAALGVGAAAIPSALFSPGVGAAVGIVAVGIAALELLEVHRPAFRAAVGGMALGIAGLATGVGIAAARSLDLGGFAHSFLNTSTVQDLGSAFGRGALYTLAYAGLGEMLGIALGLFVAVFAISRRRWVRIPAAAYVDLFRGTPLLMQLTVIYLALPFVGIQLSAFAAGVTGLSLNSAAYVAEIFRAGIQSVERGQMEAARSLGLPYRSAMRYVIVPQAVRRVIPPLMNEFVALLKDSSLVSALGTTIGSREILKVATDAYSDTANATPFVAASLIYLAMTVPLTRLVNRLDRRLRAA